MSVEQPVVIEPAESAGERSTLKKGLGFAATSFIANAFVQLLSSVLTARLYGVRTIGEYALVTAPWLTLTMFSNVSEQIALVRELSVLPARDPRVGRFFFPVLTFSTALTTTVGVVTMLLSAAALRGPIDQPDLVVPALVVLAAYVAFENVSWNLDSVFSAFRAGRELLVARLTQVISFLALAVGLYAISDSVWSLTIASVASFALALGVRLVYVRRYLASISRAELRQGFRELPRLLRFALRLVPGSVANGLSSQAATWLLGALAGVRTVGAYSRASGVAVRLQDAGYRLAEMVFPSMVEHRHRGDDAALREDVRLAIRASAIPLLLLATVGGGVAGGALRVFGAGFDEAANAFALLLLAYTLAVVSQMIGQAFLALDRPTLSTVMVIVRSVAIIGLTIPGAVWFDATGAAAALCIGYVLDVAIRLVILRRLVFHGSLASLRRTGLSVVLAGVPAFLVARLLDDALVWPVGPAAGAAAGVAVYAGVVLAAGGVTAAERGRLLARLRRGARRPTPPPS